MCKPSCTLSQHGRCQVGGGKALQNNNPLFTFYPTSTLLNSFNACQLTSNVIWRWWYLRQGWVSSKILNVKAPSLWEERLYILSTCTTESGCIRFLDFLSAKFKRNPERNFEVRVNVTQYHLTWSCEIWRYLIFTSLDIFCLKCVCHIEQRHHIVVKLCLYHCVYFLDL